MSRTQQTGATTNFEQFRRENRYKVNHTLNMILWFCILAGPAISFGILGGVFKQTSYTACIIISCVMAAVAGGDLLLLKKRPYSHIPSVVALIAMDFLLCYMTASHISIRLTWCLVPLLSLLLCDSRVYVEFSILNYLVMGLATWLEAGHYAQIRTDFTTPLLGFINILSGCTIETVVMFAAGLALSKATNGYYRKMLGQYAEVQTQKHTMEEQLSLMNSMAAIYDHVSLIDLAGATETSLQGDAVRRVSLEPGQDHTETTQRLREHVAPDMADDFWRFTDLTTMPLRLTGRNSVPGEFVDNRTGWFRAQFIRVGGEPDRDPELVVFTIQNIDADKRREEQLIRISRTDELTRVFNRHCYEEDVAALRARALPEDLALISADVNGLKAVNDSLGHAAGDELIRGAAVCLLAAIGSSGKVYRVGGDEFMAIVRTSDCGALLDGIRGKAADWRGAALEGLSVSVGCASHAEHPHASVEALEKLADASMYAAKESHYRDSGADRRK